MNPNKNFSLKFAKAFGLLGKAIDAFKDLDLDGAISSVTTVTRANTTPKTAPKVAKEKAVAAKPSKEPKAKTAPKAAVSTSSKPKLVDSIAISMGREKMTAKQILGELSTRGWAPQVASDPVQYIAMQLSVGSKTEDKDGNAIEPIFERVDRGVYKVFNPKHYTQLANKIGTTAGKPKATEEVAAPVVRKAKSTKVEPLPEPENDPEVDKAITELNSEDVNPVWAD